MHTVTPVPEVRLSNNVSGTNVNRTIVVEGVVQPDSTVNVSIDVEYNGETVSTPVSVVFDQLIAPTAVVVSSDPRLNITLGVPQPATATSWQIPLNVAVA
jgi:hypothetical protein